MAPKRGTRSPQGRDDDDDFEELSAEDQAADVDNEVYKVVEELEGDVEARVRLMRREENGIAYLPSMPAAEFTVDRVAELYGGGKYVAKIYVGRQYKAGKSFTISASVKPTATATTHGPGPGGEGTLGTVVTRLLDERGVTQRAPTAQADPFQMAKEIVGLVAQLMPKAGAAAATPTLDSEIERASKLVDLGKKLAGGASAASEASGEGSDTVRLIEAAERLGAPLIQMAREKMASDRAGQGATRPAAVVGEIKPAAPAAPTSGETGMMGLDPWLKELSSWLPWAVREAEAKAPAVSAAAYMVDRISDETYDHLIEFAGRPDSVELIIKYAAPLAAHRDWVIDWLKAIQETEEKDTPDGGGDGGLPPASNIVKLN